MARGVKLPQGDRPIFHEGRLSSSSVNRAGLHRGLAADVCLLNSLHDLSHPRLRNPIGHTRFRSSKLLRILFV